MDTKITSNGYIHKDTTVISSEFGKYTEIGKGTTLENVILGDYSYSSEHCIIQNAEIGKFVNIAAMVRIGPTHHPMERPTLHHFTYRRKKYGFDIKDDEEFFEERKKRKVIIGNDVWIGHGAIIMPGVKIGDGAIIGSGSIVTKDVERYSIVVGAPASLLRYRFSKEICEQLQEIKWWDWSHERISENFNDFLLDINEFVEKHYENR